MGTREVPKAKGNETDENNHPKANPKTHTERIQDPKLLGSPKTTSSHLCCYSSLFYTMYAFIRNTLSYKEIRSPFAVSQLRFVFTIAYSSTYIAR